MVLTRSSSKKTAVQNEERREDFLAMETPVRKLSRELASLGIRAPPGTPCQKSSTSVGDLQVPTTEPVLDQVTKKYLGFGENQSVRSDSEEYSPESSTTSPHGKATVEAIDLASSNVLSDIEQVSLKENLSWQQQKFQQDSDDTHREELKEGWKSFQEAEEHRQDSHNIVSTPINQSVEASFQLIGNDASNEWCGEHVRFSILGKSKVKVHHQPRIKTSSPSNEQKEGDTSITEDNLQNVTPEPQRLDFGFDLEEHFPFKLDDETEDLSPETKSSPCNETEKEILSTKDVTSIKPKKNNTDSVCHLKRQERNESSKKKSQTTHRDYLTENSHFSKHTQSSAAKDKKLALEKNILRDKENIDKGGNSVRWKGHHIRFEDSPDFIGEKMKSLHLDDVRFMKPTVSTSAKRSEPRRSQEFASKYLWRF